MTRAGRLLARRAHSEAELRRKLGAHAPAEVVERVLTRLRAVGLVDDAAFSRAWAKQGSRRTGLGRSALLAGLESKGVAREVAEAVLSEDGDDEVARAIEVACGLVGRLAHRPLADQAARLLGMLGRRGFSPDAAEAAVRSVLPPEGWD